MRVPSESEQTKRQLDQHLEALRIAGWDDLTRHEQDWVTRRLTWAASRLGDEVLSRTNNPGGLRSSRYGNAGTIVDFAWPDVGHAALVGAARRAAFQIGVPVPPAIPAYLFEVGGSLERADSGDLPSKIEVSMAVEAAVRDLRQQWEALDRVGVGAAILPEMKPKVDAWRRFRDAWDRGELGEDEEPGWHVRVGGEVTQLINDANAVLRAGVWEEESPERQKIEELRERLRLYRGRLETSGPPPLGQSQKTREILQECDRTDRVFEQVMGYSVKPVSALTRRRIEAADVIEGELDRLSEPVWHAPGEIGAIEVRVGLAVGALLWSDIAQGRLERLQIKTRTHEDAVGRLIPGQCLTADRSTCVADVRKREYVARWDSFLREVDALAKRAGETFSTAQDAELDPLELRFNNLLLEWDLLRKRDLAEEREIAIRAAEDALKQGKITQQQLEDIARGKYPLSDVEPSEAAKLPTPPPAPSFWDEIPLQAKIFAAAILAIMGVAAVRR